jgi:hypothetical protein
MVAAAGAAKGELVMEFSRPGSRLRCPVFLLVGFMAIAPIHASAMPADSDKTDTKPPDHVLTYDHKSGSKATFEIDARDGDKIELDVTNTCEKAFDYSVKNQIGEASVSSETSSDCDEGQLTTRSVTWKHSDKYGGYLVDIDHKPVSGGTQEVEDAAPKGVQLVDHVTLAVLVHTIPSWSYEIAGAFTGSKLTDPVYATDADGNIAEDRDKEDSMSLGIATLAHVYKPRWPWAALSFGVGINQASKPIYYLGGTWRWSGVGGLTVGAAFGPVARLPNGVNIGETPKDSNALSNLSSKNRGKLFVAVSFGFLGRKDDDLKAFAPAPAPAKPKDNAKGDSDGTK